MFENPQKFLEKVAEGQENLSVSELKKLKRKANKAKAAQEREKQNGQLQGKQVRVDRSLNPLSAFLCFVRWYKLDLKSQFNRNED